ncbi:hypothetical protein FH972_010405 [Carpinus fangiana]|uniref:Alcohol dehydrogenase-like C-terminal domain-containing protein n=1 Tax=Carpinus fangiana TaxID=176857 RepID=A0A660KQ79_9ROSI|nr:hypothetical protein FH972_010405 [Carpinus fangiana]
MGNVLNGGGLAEFAVTNESLTVARPPELSAAKVVGLSIAGLTAHQAVTQAAGIKLDGSGKKANILITAASGGVGHYAVQLAKLGNAHVTATCGARNIQLVKSLGADEVLDYRTPDGAALRSPSGQKYDAVIHCAIGIPWSTFEPNLSPNGKGENLHYLVNLVKEGKLKTVIDSKYPLAKARDAWAKSIDGHATGKIIVEPAPSIPFIAIRKESFVVVGCHLAPAHCLVQLAYSSKQPVTNLNSTNDHALLAVTRQPCRPSYSTPCLHKCPANFLPLDHVLQAWHSTIMSTVAAQHVNLATRSSRAGPCLSPFSNHATRVNHLDNAWLNFVCNNPTSRARSSLTLLLSPRHAPSYLGVVVSKGVMHTPIATIRAMSRL